LRREVQNVPTKTPGKGKKSTAATAKDGAAAATPAPGPHGKKGAQAKARERDPDAADEDDLPATTPVAKKPAAKPRAGANDVEPPPVVPARRLTPEAKAQVNAMVQKGVPLAEALKMAASWETFVAPVKEEPAKLVQGKTGDGGPRPSFRDSESDGESERDDEEEPAADAED
jgi:hypothetical protein